MIKNNDTQTVSEEEEVHASPSHNKFGKVFREEDEIGVLEGLYVYWKCNGVNHEWKKYHDFIKDDLPHHFSSTQLSEKIRRLRLKFQSNSRNNNIHFRNAHESLVFDLSKKLWEQELISSSSSSSSTTNTTPPAVGRKICDADADADADGAGDDDEESIKIASKKPQKQEFDAYPHLSALFDRFGFSASKYLTCRLNKKKLRKLEKHSRKLIMQENQLLLQQMLLRKKQCALVVSALKKFNS
ncbi:hypothetical protein MIMGU_mgv1a019218mg [Erythranthe guttata]|uniref:Glabrous enhancer-binding protein-like DBD domain-containing protein n=1 Tax=Erythranthe guttata TaxID=4155 RepID=A0A022PX85_ERYGU|nr:PREDICTED: uncharacterized protein LOC105976440 [Erythranthe guttata]EYU20957.1 hypothetical protein MIMGU_mgv1a019218mg [Erythranthe guttata]|eukprot:XP_012857159.1 PREDICTED: uncharacterized protein LOC105976440 [Erythranthe guttata]